MFSVWISKEDGYYFECISLINKIFSELQKRNYLSPELYSKIKPAIDEINKDFLSKDLSSAYLASVCDISESYLKKLFKKKFGVPPKRYIIQKKINYACELLLLGRYSINQIAELCNFSDVYYFSKQFKEQMGVSLQNILKSTNLKIRFVLFASRRGFVVYLNKSNAFIITFPLPSLFCSISYFSEEAVKISSVSIATSYFGVEYFNLFPLHQLKERLQYRYMKRSCIFHFR